MKPLKESIGYMPSVPTFRNLAILLTEQGKFQEAINVCHRAINFDVDDGTEGGFEARIERIKKLAAKQ